MEKSYVDMSVKHDASEYLIVNSFSNSSEKDALPLLRWMSGPYFGERRWIQLPWPLDEEIT